MSFDPDEVVDRIRREAGRRLLAAALTLQTDHRLDLSVGNPSPHKNPAPKGQFPRLRTGNLRSGIAITPASIPEVLARGGVAVGYRQNAAYGVFLGAKGWKWIIQTYEAERAAIDRILAGGRA